MEADPALNTLPLSEQERADHVPAMLSETMDLLMKHSGTVSDRALDGAVDHGRARRRQGYTIPMILKEGRYVRRVITEMVQQNLLAVDISYLLGDLILASDAIDV